MKRHWAPGKFRGRGGGRARGQWAFLGFDALSSLSGVV